ncbi:ferritin-like domain-containing protein [Geodermatophilus sp. SYSU D01180]
MLTEEQVPPEFNGHDYAVFLLRVAAEIEHSLMAQYLFAAYSLGGPDVPTERAGDVRAWQETILGIAKEEMGHLVTVQNLLTVLGGPRNFQRDDYPIDTPLYPFGFRLEPLGLSSLATYVCAESPAEWDDAEAREIMDLAEVRAGEPVNRVGELFAQLIRLLEDPGTVPESAFQAQTVAFQASWDEWGRGYREGQRGLEVIRGLDLPAPELLIVPVDSRATALSALRQIAEQGEGFDSPPDENESHFRRFLAIYRALKALGDGVGAVVRPVAANPTTGAVEGGDPDDPGTPTAITHPEALLWAHLFNLRYRKLLVNLSHAFELADDPTDRTTLTPRGALIHRTFSEMYNLRAIAGLLTRLPVSADDPDGPRAGPPFQMPYTLVLPSVEADRWRLHRDLLDAAGLLTSRLRTLTGPGDGTDYLAALSQWDGIERGHVEQLIAAPAVPVVTGGGALRDP